MSIRYLDLKAIHSPISEEISEIVSQVVKSGSYILGDQTRCFEKEWSEFCEARECVGVASGFDAIRLALIAVGIGRGDQVLVPANTFIATWLAVSSVGAVPIPVEPCENTFNIDVEGLLGLFNERTKAVIAVHMYGQPVELSELAKLCRRMGVSLIEDAAHAHGARYKGRRIGSHGDAVCWSFYPGKNLGALGDGGAVTTNRVEIAERIRVLRNYGSAKKYEYERIGINSRLDELQASILRIKLRYLEQWNAARQKNAHSYNRFFRECKLSLGGERMKPQKQHSDSESVWHVYIIRHPKRDYIQDRLDAMGIETLIHYPIIPADQVAYSKSKYLQKYDMSTSRRLAGELLSLPVANHLTNEDVRTIINSLEKICYSASYETEEVFWMS